MPATASISKKLPRTKPHAQPRKVAAAKGSGFPDRKGNVRTLANQLTALRGAGAFKK